MRIPNSSKRSKNTHNLKQLIGASYSHIYGLKLYRQHIITPVIFHKLERPYGRSVGVMNG